MQIKRVIFQSRLIVFTQHLQVIALDPSLPWGYETQHAALHKAGYYDKAVEAFETMIVKMSFLSDQTIHSGFHCHVKVYLLILSSSA